MTPRIGSDFLFAPGITVSIALLDLCVSPVSVVREDGLIFFGNAVAKRIFASSMKAKGPDNVVGMNLRELDPPEFFAERVALLQRLAAEERDGVIRDIWEGEQIMTHFRLLPRQTPDEKLRMFLVVHERAAGPATTTPRPGTELHEPENQMLGPLAKLSPRELEVLALVGEGMTAAQIAARLERSEETINTHRASLLRKLNCQNAVQLGVIAYRAGLKVTDAARFA